MTGHLAHAGRLVYGDVGGDGRYLAVPDRHICGLEFVVLRPAGVNDLAAFDEQIVLHQQSRLPRYPGGCGVFRLESVLAVDKPEARTGLGVPQINLLESLSVSASNTDNALQFPPQ